MPQEIRRVNKGEGKYLTLIYDQLDRGDDGGSAARDAVQVGAGFGL